MSDSASREILFNVGGPLNQAIFYGIYYLCLAVCLFGLWSHLWLVLQGKPAARFRPTPKRILTFLRDTLLQRKVNRERRSGFFHSLIFYGFMVLVFTTTMVFIDHELGFKIYHGNFYLAVTVASDLFGLFLFIGVLLAVHRRYIIKPDKLHSSTSDAAMLLFLAVLVIQGFLLEALRIAITNDPWAQYSPIGYLFAQAFWGLSEFSLRKIHYLTWWMHSLLTFAFIAFIPYSKFFHFIASSANLFFQKLYKHEKALAYPGDIETILTEAAESENGDFSIGVCSAKDLTWKHLLDLEACTSCGRCQDVCPAYNSGKALSPKWLIQDTREHLLTLHSKPQCNDSFLIALTRKSLALSLAFTGFDQKNRSNNELVNASRLKIGGSWEQKLAGEVLDEEVFWSCTSCRACVEVCPVGIDHVDYIMQARRSLALIDGAIPNEAQKSLKAIETRGNPFGPANERTAWANGLDVKILEAGESVDVLYWVGCISAYDKRKQSIARAMVNILNTAGVNWGMLGNKECCTGDPARRLGEENLFQTQAKQNIASFQTVSFKTLVTHCPHCFNAFENEYPAVGPVKSSDPSKLRIIHHSTLIRELLDAGTINIKSEAMPSITFHDPCYLGRYNDNYTDPRDVLVQLGSPSKEMRETQTKAKCCGAGGGHFWMDMKVGERVNVQRVEQAAETGASTIATGCPFCMQMLEDGAKLSEKAAAMEVRDIAELVSANLR